MSYYDRLAREYGEMGNSKVQQSLDSARNVAQEAEQTSGQLIQTLRSKELGKFGQIIGEKVGGKFVMNKAVGAVKKYYIDPKRADLTNQQATLKSQAEGKGRQADDIYDTGQDRLAQGFNADGSLTADRGMTVRGSLDQNLKFREGDILPEDAVRDPDGAMAGIDKVSALNKERYNGLDADAQDAVKAQVRANPNYRSTADIAQDKTAGNLTREEAENQRLNSKMIEQDAIGDQEETASTVTTGMNPYTGTTVRGAGGREVTGQMGDTPEEALDRTTGLSRTEQSTADRLTGEEVGLTTEGAELGGATLAETALSAIPVIGEIIGLGFGLGDGIKDAVKTAKETAQQTADMKADDQNINNTVKYAGYNRPNFGSMALPSFDTSKSSALLQE
tara:strand:+ start:3392 stop:4564 length:1173 start_codon:yes stop_codon:yes gene_type:complete